MFHVATYLPFSTRDQQQIERKRYILKLHSTSIDTSLNYQVAHVPCQSYFTGMLTVSFMHVGIWAMIQ